MVGGDVEAVEAQAELAHDWVLEVLDSGGVETHVVRSPVGAERIALRGELADEVGEISVVGIATGGRAQDRGGVACGAVPVDVEGLGSRVEEDEPRVVRRPAG